MSFSHPLVARLINRAFVPVVFSMHLEGIGTDRVGREFASRYRRPDRSDLYPPDLFVVSPGFELLGRLDYAASAEETRSFLCGILQGRPGLAPLEDPGTCEMNPPLDPSEIELQELADRYQFGEKASIVPKIEEWLTHHGDRLSNSDALARVLLGGGRFHSSDYAGAVAAWQSVILRYPNHPLRHRAAYNLVERDSMPAPPHPELRDALHPSVVERGVVVPNPKVRMENLRLVRDNPSYFQLGFDLPWVRVPAGTFVMGGSPAIQYREAPTRQVTLTKPILMSAWPVTRRLWQLFQPDRYSIDEVRDLAGELPATKVTWFEGQAFCRFLSKRCGRIFRMPTEAEWEYAARGGIEGASHPWGNETPDETRCNYLHPRIVPVACYPANGYGVFDMVGNTLEWASDYYLADSYARTHADVVDPQGPGLGEFLTSAADRYVWRVARGGGWMGTEMSKIGCRNSYRIGLPEFYPGNVGLRLVTEDS